MSTLSQGPARASGDSLLTRRAIAEAKAGNREGLHYLYVRYADDVAGFVRDRSEAEDITRKVFVNSMTTIQKYEQDAVPFSPWIMQVARNAALDHLRAKRPIPTEEAQVVRAAAG